MERVRMHIDDGGSGDDAGCAMLDGSITIMGKAEKNVGRIMRGGRIDLEGEYDGISGQVICGEIFHRGVPFFGGRNL